jgi:hypothetical protein
MFARPEPVRPRANRSERPDPRPWLIIFGLAVLLRAATGLARGGAPLAAGAGPLATWVASLVQRLIPGAAANTIAFALIGALAPIAVAALGSAMFGGSVGRWAAIACAFDPILIGADPAATTAASAIVLGVLATAAWVRTPRPGRALGVGIAWSLAALADPPFAVAPLLVAAWAWVPLGLTISPGDRLRQILLMIGGVVAMGALAMASPAARTLIIDGFAAGLGGASRWLDVALPPVATWGRIPAVLALALVPLAVWGAARALMGPRRWFQSLPVLLAALALVLAILRGDAFARAPFEPLAALLAAVGFEDARRRMRAKTHGLRVIRGSAS